ncbi:hypothetical protein K525DRAFT_285815 [Schizophyllum commune Loenen D]|nr:hypothetical protein K525DRAFT_285815 [Schizophyllum commune Loenen D]
MSSKMKAVRRTVVRCHKPLTAKDIIRGPGAAKDRFPLLQRSRFGVPPQAFDYDCDRSRMTVDEIADNIRTARQGGFHYRVRTKEIAVVEGPSTALTRSVIDARGLSNFTVLGDNSLKDATHQLAQLLYSLHAPDVSEVKILRPGRSTKYYERAVYHFLSSLSTRTSLQHVSLNMQCCYKPGLGKYLRSAAARHLVSLRLQTSANVEEYLVGALLNSHMLPNLQQLTLRGIPELTPERLFENLRKRYDAGHTLPLLVEWDRKIPTEIVSAARKLRIFFQKLE